MTKLCPRGKAAAKRKFKVYPSAYANAYASKICAGKIKDPSGVKRKDFRGSKAKGGRIGYSKGTPKFVKEMQQKKVELGLGKFDDQGNFQAAKRKKMGSSPKEAIKQRKIIFDAKDTPKPRKNRAGGGLMEATARLKRQGLGMGGSVCKIAKRGQNRDAIGKNS